MPCIGGEVEEKKATEDHSMQADINNNVVLLRNVSHVTLAILVTGLLSCPHAWAETEIVSIEEVGNWINDLDGVKNGFISVSTSPIVQSNLSTLSISLYHLR